MPLKPQGDIKKKKKCDQIRSLKLFSLPERIRNMDPIVDIEGCTGQVSTEDTQLAML